MDENNTRKPDQDVTADEFSLENILREFRAGEDDERVSRVQLGQTPPVGGPEPPQPEAADEADAETEASGEAASGKPARSRGKRHKKTKDSAAGAHPAQTDAPATITPDAESPEPDAPDSAEAPEPDSRIITDEDGAAYAAPDVEPLPEDSPLRRPEPRRPGLAGQALRILIGLLALAAGKVRRSGGSSAPELDTDDDAPEMSAANAARCYRAMGRPLRMRSRLAFLVCLPLVWLSYGLPAAGLLGTSTPVRALVCLVLLLTVMLIGVDILAAGFTALLRRRPSAESLVFFSCVFSVADALLIALTGNDKLGLPYCGVSALSLAFSLYGSRMFCHGLAVSMRTLSQSRFPWALTAEDDLTGSGTALLKSHRSAAGFVRRSEEPDAVESLYATLTPILLPACLALSAAAALILKSAPAFLHVLSALTAACACFSAALSFSAPFCVTARRLSRSGAAIAGCAGARDIGKSRNVVITDGDLFPPGTISIEEVRILEGIPSDRAIAYTGSIIAASGSGLAPVFTDLMRRNGCIIHTLTDFAFRDGGGLTAIIGGQSVVVGSAAFLQLSGIRVPQKGMSRTAVFTAVGGKLVAIFAIKYTPSATVQAALLQLLRSRREPLFAIRDFNITPQMIKQHFRLPGEHFDFPPFAERCRLSSASPAAESPLTAVLARDGLEPLVAASGQGRRLWRAVRTLTALTGVCSVLGMVLMFLLSVVGSFDAASAGHLMTYMLFWLVPAIVLTLGLKQ